MIRSTSLWEPIAPQVRCDEAKAQNDLEAAEVFLSPRRCRSDTPHVVSDTKQHGPPMCHSFRATATKVYL